MQLSPTAHGQLVVWTDVDPAHEADFNLWYNREHMAERVSIPGMPWARRYIANDSKVRRYLAIYRTENMGVFSSDAYRQAFANQTDWSNRNFARMRNTQRRVMEVMHEGGFGAGGVLAVIEIAPDAGDSAQATLKAMLENTDGLLRGQFLLPNLALSTPLPSEDTTNRVMRPILLIDAVSQEDAEDTIRLFRRALGPLLHSAQTFRLIWSLDAADLRARS